MASSRSSALRDGRTTDHKEIAAIAADRLAGRQPEHDDVPMETKGGARPYPNLITVATESEEAGLRNDVPQDDIAVLAAGGKDGARGSEA